MLGEFVTSALLLVLGYAYPAFECYKTIEKNRVDNEELRFWCQYWIIVACLRIVESIGDVFMSWLPMYSEAKLALFIYLWYPKTKGTGFIYDSVLKPYVSKHEIDIDRSLLGFRDKAFDLAIYYWQNCTELGQAKFFQMIEYVASQSRRGTQPSTSEDDKANQSGRAPPRSPSPGLFRRNNPQSDRRRPPPSPTSSSPRRSIFRSSKSEFAQIHPEDVSFIDSVDGGEPGHNRNFQAKLRRANKGIS